MRDTTTSGSVAAILCFRFPQFTRTVSSVPMSPFSSWQHSGLLTLNMTVAILISGSRSRDIKISLMLFEMPTPQKRRSSNELDVSGKCRNFGIRSQCLPCARIAISAIFSTGSFYRIAFPVTPMTLFSALTTRMCENVGSIETFESASINFKAFESYLKKTEGVDSAPCMSVLIYLYGTGFVLLSYNKLNVYKLKSKRINTEIEKLQVDSTLVQRFENA
jgi:hypothetical protein